MTVLLEYLLTLSYFYIKFISQVYRKLFQLRRPNYEKIVRRKISLNLSFNRILNPKSSDAFRKLFSKILRYINQLDYRQRINTEYVSE